MMSDRFNRRYFFTAQQRSFPWLIKPQLAAQLLIQPTQLTLQPTLITGKEQPCLKQQKEYL